MRAVKFRGIIIESGEWIFGSLVVCVDGSTRIYEHMDLEEEEEIYANVDPKTVGQFTGVTDNFHKDVYDGDIFQTGQGSLFMVNWNEEECQWTALCFAGEHQGVFYLKKFMGENMEVIGNAYENSDLLLNR